MNKITFSVIILVLGSFIGLGSVHASVKNEQLQKVHDLCREMKQTQGYERHYYPDEQNAAYISLKDFSTKSADPTVKDVAFMCLETYGLLQLVKDCVQIEVFHECVIPESASKVVDAHQQKMLKFLNSPYPSVVNDAHKGIEACERFRLERCCDEVSYTQALEKFYDLAEMQAAYQILQSFVSKSLYPSVVTDARTCMRQYEQVVDSNVTPKNVQDRGG